MEQSEEFSGKEFSDEEYVLPTPDRQRPKNIVFHTPVRELREKREKNLREQIKRELEEINISQEKNNLYNWILSLKQIKTKPVPRRPTIVNRNTRNTRNIRNTRNTRTTRTNSRTSKRKPNNNNNNNNEYNSGMTVVWKNPTVKLLEEYMRALEDEEIEQDIAKYKKERISKEHFESLYHQSLKNDEEHTNELIKRYQDKIKKEELLNKDKQIYDEIDKILETLELYATQLEDLEAESVSITNSNNNNKNRKIEKIDDDSIIIMDNADKLLQKIEELKKQKEKIKQKLNKTRRKKLKSSN